MRIEAQAPAKLVLVGEYAVLGGAPALVAAVDRTVRVTLHPRTDGAWPVTSDLDGGRAGALAFDADGALAPGASWLRPLEAALAAAAARVGRVPATLPGADVGIASAALRHGPDGTKLGLGSSAAVVTALVAALDEALVRWSLDERRPVDLAAVLAVHRSLQDGRGSGIDVAASAGGGVQRYRLVDGHPEAAPLALPQGLRFGVAWTGHATSTAAYVARVEAWSAEAPAAHAARMEALAATSAAACAACAADDADAFLAAVDAYREGMAALGEAAGLDIVSADHAALAALAARAGAVAKPSGAGGGDVGLLFASSEAALVEAGRLAGEAGYVWVPLDVAPDGVRVHCHERTAS